MAKRDDNAFNFRYSIVGDTVDTTGFSEYLKNNEKYLLWGSVALLSCAIIVCAFCFYQSTKNKGLRKSRDVEAEEEFK